LSQGKDALTYANKERGRQRDIGRDAIRVASAFHDCISRLHLAIQSSATISGSSLLINKPTGDDAQVIATDQRSQTATEAGLVFDTKDSEDEDEAALLHELASLKTYDLHTFADAVTRTMSLVKKWQKSCKQYRDKARDKLAFSNFAKGDLVSHAC
jgi:autophagy-related protein 11